MRKQMMPQLLSELARSAEAEETVEGRSPEHPDEDRARGNRKVDGTEIKEWVEAHSAEHRDEGREQNELYVG